MKRYKLKDQIADLKADIREIEADKAKAIGTFNLDTITDVENLLADLYSELEGAEYDLAFEYGEEAE